MPRIELELNDETLECARHLAEAAHCSVDELFTRLLDEAVTSSTLPDRILGMMAHEPDLMDQVLQSAMKARAERLLRRAGG